VECSGVDLRDCGGDGDVAEVGAPMEGLNPNPCDRWESDGWEGATAFEGIVANPRDGWKGDGDEGLTVAEG